MDETAHFMDETAHFLDENVTFQIYGSKGHFMDETAKLMEKKNTSLSAVNKNGKMNKAAAFAFRCEHFNHFISKQNKCW